MKQPTAMDQRTAIAASRCRACGGNGCSFCFGKVKDEVLAEQRDRIAELEAENARLREELAILKKCPDCGLGDIELVSQCSNSDCGAYAVDITLYCGWRDNDKAEQS